ncbi:MAG: hypothetical protein AAB354_15690 [candidate division KSB1 bacterium]
MNKTIVLPQQLHDEVRALTRELGFTNFEAAVCFLLQSAVLSERIMFVVRLYQNNKKTLRQCAELLEVDLEGMIDILCALRIPFNGDLEHQIATVKKLAPKTRRTILKKKQRAQHKRAAPRKKAAAAK